MMDPRQPIEKITPPSPCDAALDLQTRIAVIASVLVSFGLSLAILWPSLRLGDTAAAYEDFRHPVRASDGIDARARLDFIPGGLASGAPANGEGGQGR